ncbi:MAG: ImmA/IrrE family metallo-endopeptidase [Candidatus Parcubacteria bacterium]|nr:ImmA/IrrE family metallo-endopeptidase [Candidatus Parcubacteria bacterium]
MMQIPYFKNQELKQKADEFRIKNWGDSVPVEIEQIIESKLGIGIIPIPGLYKQCNADALISSDWKTIYVDNDNYIDDRYYNRLRFSLAHEVGHFILHKDLYSSFEISSVEDFYNLIERIGDKYGIIEGHANRFANFLLVPREKLGIEKEKVLQTHPEIKEFETATVNSYIAIPLSKIFEVSQDVIEISLSNNK